MVCCSLLSKCCKRKRNVNKIKLAFAENLYIVCHIFAMINKKVYRNHVSLQPIILKKLVRYGILLFLRQTTYSQCQSLQGRLLLLALYHFRHKLQTLQQLWIHLKLCLLPSPSLWGPPFSHSRLQAPGFPNKQHSLKHIVLPNWQGPLA